MTAYCSNVQIGVKGGIDYSRFRLWRAKELRGHYPGPGWSGGMFVRLNAKENFSFQIEMLLSQDQGLGVPLEALPNESAIELSLNGRFSLITLNIFDNLVTMQLMAGVGF